VELFGEYALNMSSDFLNVSYDVHVVITRKWSLGLLVLPGANPPPPCSHGNAVCTISSESLRYDPTTSLIQDIELSREINESFRQSAQARTKLPSGIELNVHVLTTGYWPTYPPMEVRVPLELNVYQDIFKEFYLSKHSGRRLMWQNSLGYCVLKANFPKGKKELSVSLFQVTFL
jgi:hypothetical protein